MNALLDFLLNFRLTGGDVAGINWQIELEKTEDFPESEPWVVLKFYIYDGHDADGDKRDVFSVPMDSTDARELADSLRTMAAYSNLPYEAHCCGVGDLGLSPEEK